MIRPDKLFAASLVFVSLIQAPLRAQEKKIQRSDLPAAVEKTVAEQSQGALIKGFSQEVQNGQTLYEVEMVVESHGKDLLIDSNGAIVEVEEEMLWDVVPAAVKRGILDAGGKNKVLKVETITRNGQLVGYEAQIDKKGEVSVGPTGKPLKKS